LPSNASLGGRVIDPSQAGIAVATVSAINTST
jgi:hypothetical protein